MKTYPDIERQPFNSLGMAWVRAIRDLKTRGPSVEVPAQPAGGEARGLNPQSEQTSNKKEAA